LQDGHGMDSPGAPSCQLKQEPHAGQETGS
jgi:hypothetical protein